MSTLKLPLFPLGTVLFPRGPLNLRIFEPRYLDMVKHCSANNVPFGVCLIVDGGEVGQPAKTVAIGTQAKIVDFYTMQDGLLGISAHGLERFRVVRTSVRDNGLLMGEVEVIPNEIPKPVEVKHALLVTVLERLMEQVGKHYPDPQPGDFENAVWVGFRLAELLPLEMHEKQGLLELDDAQARLDALLSYLPRFQVD